jgi:hypothetical protein
MFLSLQLDQMALGCQKLPQPMPGFQAAVAATVTRQQHHPHYRKHQQSVSV